MFGVNDIKKMIYSNKHYTRYIRINIGLVKSETASILSFNYKNRF